METKTIQALVTTGVVVILVAALLTAISSETQSKSVLQIQTDTFDLAPARTDLTVDENYNFTLSKGAVTGWRADNTADCGISTLTVLNQTSGTLTNGACGTGDYYYVANAGQFVFCNSDKVNRSVVNTTTASYSYCGDDYLSSSWSRSLLNTVPGLIAIALLVTVVYLTYLLLGAKPD